MTNDIESWKPVLLFPEYNVSSWGRIKRVSPAGGAAVGRIRKLSKRNGYFKVCLWSKGIQYDRDVHVLVCEAFHGARPFKQDVRHKNGIKTDNHSSNLEWGTRSQNLKDAVRHGTNWQTAKIRCPLGHLLMQPNLRRAAFKRGHRGCLACSRARTKVRNAAARKGITLKFSTEADTEYYKIMKDTSGDSDDMLELQQKLYRIRISFGYVL